MDEKTILHWVVTGAVGLATFLGRSKLEDMDGRIEANRTDISALKVETARAHSVSQGLSEQVRLLREDIGEIKDDVGEINRDIKTLLSKGAR